MKLILKIILVIPAIILLFVVGHKIALVYLAVLFTFIAVYEYTDLFTSRKAE